jgi:Leucine-rich repeat (LRR) protein
LEKLNLANNEIKDSDLKFLEDFDYLKEVNLKNNSIKSIDEANKLKNIEKINLYGNNINLYPNEEKDDNFIDEIDEIFENNF